MAQSWHDLLFAHWPVPVEALRARIPAPLTLDTRDGQAWLGVVPFRMSGVRLRGLPALPWLSAFPELNVRTYVTLGGKPGVYFFSLDAANAPAVVVGRAWFYLPYQRAWMACQAEGEAVRYASRRTQRGAHPAELRASYRAIGPVSRAERGSLAHWLTERYCLYSVDRNGRVWRGEIHHEPWPLQPAEASFETLDMVDALGLPLQGAPLLHFARRLDVQVWPPRLVRWRGRRPSHARHWRRRPDGQARCPPPITAAGLSAQPPASLFRNR
jgi:hypothetical protein